MTRIVCLVFIDLDFFKGGGHLDSPLGITCGSPGYWISSGIMFGWILFVSHFIRTRLVALTVAKKVEYASIFYFISLAADPYWISFFQLYRWQRLGYEYVEGDIAWDNRATVVYPLVCIGAGMCAGMFGIGGGIIQVPLMLQMVNSTVETIFIFHSLTHTPHLRRRVTQGRQPESSFCIFCYDDSLHQFYSAHELLCIWAFSRGLCSYGLHIGADSNLRRANRVRYFTPSFSRINPNNEYNDKNNN